MCIYTHGGIRTRIFSCLLRETNPSFRAPAAYNVKFVSEVEEAEFETVVLAGASSNTEQGHCQKTEAILDYFNANAEANDW
jgi:hypothetical protein